jgi:hypothetical protein
MDYISFCNTHAESILGFLLTVAGAIKGKQIVQYRHAKRRVRKQEAKAAAESRAKADRDDYLASFSLPLSPTAKTGYKLSHIFYNALSKGQEFWAYSESSVNLCCQHPDYKGVRIDLPSGGSGHHKFFLAGVEVTSSMFYPDWTMFRSMANNLVEQIKATRLETAINSVPVVKKASV